MDRNLLNYRVGKLCFVVFKCSKVYNTDICSVTLDKCIYFLLLKLCRSHEQKKKILF